jgi:hypothetical protein
MTSALASLLMLPAIRTATGWAALLLLKPSSTRHLTSAPVTIPRARAACETITPGCSVSSTSHASASVKLQRCLEMPAGTDVNAAELHSARPPALRDTAMASPAAPDHCERTWLSPLFPVKPRPSERSRIDGATTIGL